MTADDEFAEFDTDETAFDKMMANTDPVDLVAVPVANHHLHRGEDEWR